jgi:peroxiredoxin
LCYPRLVELRDRYAEIVANGAQVVVVATTPVETSKFIADDLGLPYPLLSDPAWTIFKGYGTGAAMGVPLPAQFLLDGGGRVLERYVCDFLPAHPPLDETLEKIRA